MKPAGVATGNWQDRPASRGSPQLLGSGAGLFRTGMDPFALRHVTFLLTLDLLRAATMFASPTSVRPWGGLDFTLLQQLKFSSSPASCKNMTLCCAAALYCGAVRLDSPPRRRCATCSLHARLALLALLGLRLASVAAAYSSHPAWQTSHVAFSWMTCKLPEHFCFRGAQLVKASRPTRRRRAIGCNVFHVRILLPGNSRTLAAAECCHYSVAAPTINMTNLIRLNPMWTYLIYGLGLRLLLGIPLHQAAKHTVCAWKPTNIAQARCAITAQD